MAEKAKSQKPKPKQKVQRYKPNINLLKHLNAIMLIAGFTVSLFTVFLLTSRNDNYDIRSRSQEISPTPTATPTPVCPTGLCPSSTPGI